MLKFDDERDFSTSNSLGQKIFKQIQNDILNGKYLPGDVFTEGKLSEELGVSRTPIREALKQLELEGLVKATPGRRIVVEGISTKDIEDIYTIRMLIEGLAARWAASNITADEIAEIREALELEEFYTQKGGDTESLLKIDSRFHDLLFKACKSRPLNYILSTFHHYVQSARSASFEIPGRAEKVFEEHRDIFKAIIGKDPDLAEKLTTQHIRNAKENVMKHGTLMKDQRRK